MLKLRKILILAITVTVTAAVAAFVALTLAHFGSAAPASCHYGSQRMANGAELGMPDSSPVALYRCEAGTLRPIRYNPCPAPVRLANGTYSSYHESRTATIPSGTSVTLSDGDRWACQAGRVVVY